MQISVSTVVGVLSLSARRAWIEIVTTADKEARKRVALRKESVDRNMRFSPTLTGSTGSLSARRAWIEILLCNLLHNGRVVALRKESVDRNREQFKYVVQCRVALRKESVDRNYAANAVDQILPGSLSARRAWIEIPAGCWRESRRAVALRKESVDRNDAMQIVIVVMHGRSPQGERG